jgi:uncharacterized protein (DUF4415 family)
MTEGEDIRSYSLEEIKAMRARGDYVPTSPDTPVYEVDEDFWKNARVVMPEAKKSIHLRVDGDVLEWFRGQGSGYLTRMNAILRSYMEAHRK